MIGSCEGEGDVTVKVVVTKHRAERYGVVVRQWWEAAEEAEQESEEQHAIEGAG